VGIFEGPAPALAEIAALVEANLGLVPRYRRRVRFVPLGASRPCWVDDSRFDLAYHVRRGVLPAPGGELELCRLVGRVMSQRLDRERPLWEMWVVEGLAGGLWAVVSKVHHCVVDGVTAVELAAVPVSPSRLGPARRDAPEWRPAPEPAAAGLLAGALVDGLGAPLELARLVGRGALGPRRQARRTLATARGLATMRGLVGPAPSVSINGPLGPQRRWTWARAALSDVKAVRGVHGA
jgi:diacylglycerol O-acyltransferase